MKLFIQSQEDLAMPDIAAISALIAGIKHATDIAKVVKEADYSLEQAETKLKMAELIGSLADVKMQAAEIKELVLEKDKRIAELEQWHSETQKYKLVELASGVFVYRLEPHFAPGEPIHYLCVSCFNKNQKSILQREHKGSGGTRYFCPNCQVKIFDHSDKDKGGSISPPKIDSRVRGFDDI
jgi:hypothetical protein